MVIITNWCVFIKLIMTVNDQNCIDFTFCSEMALPAELFFVYTKAQFCEEKIGLVFSRLSKSEHHLLNK